MNGAMEQSIVDWRNWLHAKGRARTTVDGYEWEVRRLALAFPEKGPFEFKATDLNRYQAERLLAGIGDSTRKRAANAMRNFFKFTCGAGKSPARQLPVPKVKRQPQRALDWDQAGRVLAACDTSTAKGVRDLALICLLMESALRNAEVCRLELAKVDLQARRLDVVVKGGSWGRGSFDALTASYLAHWIEARKTIALPETRTLFCSVGGTKKGTPLTPPGLRVIFRQIGWSADLPNGFSPHDLRRSCATLKTRLGAPSRTIQVGGRWSNLREVETYTQAITLEDFEGYSPVQHLMARHPAEERGAGEAGL